MRNHKLLYQSSYDRGLEHLLLMWPDIKKKFPDATLDIAYGWNTFDALTANNPERTQWKIMMISRMHQDGVTDHGRIGKEKLIELQETCGILAYPSHFFEIFCISAVEAQLHGCVPVTTGIGALSETVEHGVIVEGDIQDSEVKRNYLNALLNLMSDENKRKKLSDKGREWATKFDWTKIAQQWTKEIEKTNQDIKLTVYTPTIRKGFWNIMANNLSKQTYKNFEWIIVDDYPKNRSKVAEEYAKKYSLNIVYLRGKERAVQRTYGLCNANNTALAHATGEVMVFLQDFILIPLDGLEQIATLYRKNPDALQGLPDVYVEPKIKPDSSKEDWFDGNTDVVGKFIRQNVRLTNEGLRETTNPMDYEQNYGAIPVKIAKELGGWYEFFDEGLGWDNTEIAWRAMKRGYRILIDETNVAICIDHWKTLEGTPEHGLERERRLNDPRYVWMQKMIEEEKLPLVRTQERDDTIELLYKMPKDVKPGDEVKWLTQNYKSIVQSWL